MSRYARFLPDRFTLFLVITVVLASMLPAHGKGMVAFEWIANIGIALLFFLHGARLPRDAIIAGFT
ncbi:MAG TPA: bile acid:sodium symporter, partial [Bordetella sp.]|nr:bile acid:sodium symporter [Bordetella sp.]